MTQALRDTADSSPLTLHGPRWYVVRTLVYKEHVAVHHLENQGFETFLPMVTRTIRQARRFRKARRPLFQSYLFVRFDSARDRWRSINGTMGVAHLVTMADRPAPLPNGLLETLMSMSDSAGEFCFGANLEPGDQVLVRSGPFTSFVGKLEDLTPSGRALLLLEMMGQQVRVWSDTKVLSIG